MRMLLYCALLIFASSVIPAAPGLEVDPAEEDDDAGDRIGPSEPGFLPSHALRFVEHPESAVALPGDQVFFSCKTAGGAGGAGGGPEEIRWLHNGSLLAPGAEEDYPDTSSPGGGRRESRLTFRIRDDPEEYGSQLGEYRCVAGGAGGIFVASQAADLRVANLEPFSHFSSKTKNVDAFVGNDVAIDCRVPTSQPPAFLQFYKNDQLISDLSLENAQVLNGETLLLTDIAPGDAGRYTCGATNHITSQSRMAPDFTELNVQVPNQYEKSRLTYRPKERYQVLIGDNLTIPCLASGHPKPEIIWTRVGNNQRISSEHGCLQIADVKESDAGSYMCAIYNGARRFLRRTTVVVLTPPAFNVTPSVEDGSGGVSEGSPVSLPCSAEGTPAPRVEWFFNGLPVRRGGHKELLSNGTLFIPFARSSSDQGVYQCFASNRVGRNATTPVTLRIARGNSSPHGDGGDDGDGDDFYSDDELSFWHRPSLLDHLATVPPSRPEVQQSGRHSALITWTVDPATATLTGETMPIQFFKIQFREFRRGGVRSQWRTLDDIINPRSRSFEVLGLKDDLRYRFRVVAVYADDDNLHGPLSRKFKLDKDLDSERAPHSAPTITQVLPMGPRSLRVGWRMSSVSPAVVEGYFIYIRKVELLEEEEEDDDDQGEEGNRGRRRRKRKRRRKRVGKFQKVTIIGHASHSYIFEGLEPDTSYEVKVEAFNFAGPSPPSRIARRATWPPEEEEEDGGDGESTSKNTLTGTSSSNATSSDDGGGSAGDLSDENGRVLLYVGAGVGIVVVLLAVVLCCSVVSCAQRSRARKSFTSTNEKGGGGEGSSSQKLNSSSNNRAYIATSDASAIHEKYLDTSRSISMSMMSHGNANNNSSSSRFSPASNNNLPRYFGGGVDRLQPPPPPPSSSSHNSSSNRLADEAETSFLQQQQQQHGFSNNNSSSSAVVASAATHSGSYCSSSHAELGIPTVCRAPPGPAYYDNGASNTASSSSASSSRSSLEKCSLGFEEYTDEPSVVSWKRRRRSEEIL